MYSEISIIESLEDYYHIKFTQVENNNRYVSNSFCINSEGRVKYLDLKTPNIPILSVDLFKLKELEELNLSNNNLSFLPNQIGLLKRLKKLDLSSNRLIDIPDEVFELTELKRIDLNGNFLNRIPKEIEKLQFLEYIQLSSNSIENVSNEIGSLKNLRYVDLSYNIIINIPSSIGDIHNLEYINLMNNRLEILPNSFSKLKSLRYLNISNNAINTFPIQICDCDKLEKLYISNNSIKYIPSKIGGLVQLERCNFIHNKIKEIPIELVRLKCLKELALDLNPIEYPPLKVTLAGLKEMKDFFNQIEKGRSKVSEIKLILCGNGRVGKSSILNRIINNKYNADEKETDSISILTHDLLINENQKIKLNIWDFGGQEFLHATHRFFISEKALILIVWTFKTELEAKHNLFYNNYPILYWLYQVKILSENNPIILVHNKIDEPEEDINDERIITFTKKYLELENIKANCHVSAKTNFNINNLISEINHALAESEELKSLINLEIPSSWLNIRSDLDKIKRTRNYISFQEYLNICSPYGLDRYSALNLSSNYLNPVGALIHFHENPLLKDTLILNFNWMLEAIYKVLRSPIVIEQNGFFDDSSLDEIWEGYSYDQQIRFIELMKKFELCFEIISDKKYYIIPQLLPNCNENYTWPFKESINFIYKFKFFNPNLFYRLITKLNKFNFSNKLWRNRIVIEREQTRAIVIAELETREIRVGISGLDPYQLLIIIRENIDEVKKNDQLEEKILCCCEKCLDQKGKIQEYDYAEVINLYHKNINEIYCFNSNNHINIGKLLLILTSSRFEEISKNNMIINVDHIMGGRIVIKSGNRREMKIKKVIVRDQSSAHFYERVDNLISNNTFNLDFQRLTNELKKLEPKAINELSNLINQSDIPKTLPEKKSMGIKIKEFLVSNGIQLSNNIGANALYDLIKNLF